ncbi:alpha/beta fold hydrolase [Streptomyces sp. NPDC085932]|uniref:alpha/beta fold hydrolase n=1 Tax=Streptomyces sp. NPDC085932 TaxID=3365741 RepID=UPI0037D2204E
MVKHAGKVSLVASLALLAGGVVSVTQDDGGGRQIDVGARFHQQVITWETCRVPSPAGEPSITEVESRSNLDCGVIKVPKDYRNLDGETIEIAISRLSARDKGRRLGVLVLNPGGPGGEGLFMPAKVARQNVELSRNFDLIGFDPRGTGRSTALKCDGPSRSQRVITRPTKEEMLHIMEEARTYEENCQRGNEGLRPFINTANTARDIDVMRAILSEGSISYLGVSYGSYLGAVYGTLFPGRLNRSVLDSSMHPNWLYYEATKQMPIAAKENLEEWADWVSHRNSRYGLGSSRGEVMAAIEGIADGLEGQKVSASPASPPRMSLDRNRFDQFLGTFGARPKWHKIALMVSELRLSLLKAAPLRTDLVKLIGKSATAQDDGQLNGTHATVTCEVEWPTHPDVYYEEMSRFVREFPYGKGATAAAPTACTFRSFGLTEQHVIPERKGYPAGLVVQATHDPKTPYEGGVAMARKLSHRLLTVRDEGTHGMHGSNRCATGRIAKYLIEGVLPEVGASCAGAPRPSVGAE